MDDLEIISQLIKESAKFLLCLPPNGGGGKASITLTEPKEPGVSVTIGGIPSDAIVIKADSFRSPDTVFNGGKGECKRADYVIISNDNGKKRILYIEMKKRKGNPEDVTNQLAGAFCFIGYCSEIGRIFWKKRDFLKDYEHRFVSVCHITQKKPTRIDRVAGKHDKPDKAMRIFWPNRLKYDDLVGK